MQINKILFLSNCCGCSVTSHAQLFLTTWTAARQASLSFTISQSLLKLMPIESVMPSNHLILCHPLLLWPSIRAFSNESFFASGAQSIEASAPTSVLPMSIQGWFPLGLTDSSPFSSRDSQSLLQHHSSKASILWFSALFMVQLSHLYMTTGKNMVLTIWTFSAICFFNEKKVKDRDRRWRDESRWLLSSLSISWGTYYGFGTFYFLILCAI